MNAPSKKPPEWMEDSGDGPGIGVDSAARLTAGIAELAASSDSLEVALSRVVQEVRTATGWPVGHVFAVHKVQAQRVLRSAQWSYADQDRFARFREASDAMEGQDVQTVVDSGGLVGKAIDNGAFVALDDLPNEDSFPRARIAKDAGLVSAFAVPVFAEREIVAVVEFFHEEPDESPGVVEQTLELLARELGHVASRERLREAVRSAARHAREQMAVMRKNLDRVRSAEERWHLLARAVEDGLWDWDLAANEIELAGPWREMLGLEPEREDRSPDPWFDRIHPDDRKRVEDEILAHACGETPTLACRHRVKSADGSWSDAIVRGVAAVDEAGAAYRLVGTLQLALDAGIDREAAPDSASEMDSSSIADATPALITIEPPEIQPMFDPVTELPLEALFCDRIDQAIRRRTRRPDELFAVLFLELGGLDEIRRRGGDVSEVLLAVGRRLEMHVRRADTIARLGDRLGVLLEGIDNLEDASQAANRMLRDIARPVPFEATTVTLYGHIGLVLSRTSYDRAEALQHDARVAMRTAVSRNKPIHVFDFAAHENAEKFLRLEGDLRRALDRDEFYLEYQPIVSMDSGRITGLEAFIRWKHPERGLIPPSTFVPVAESSPLIKDIGFWVIERACTQIRSWQDRLGDATPPVGINITARQLYDDELADRVRDILELNNLNGKWIRFDIAESDLMQDASRAAVILSRLQGLGIKVAIDDFGTGYSSLSELHYFPAETLKIDRSFVSRPREKERGWGVAQTIVELAGILGMEVIAEGVETREQFQYLRQLGCGQAQGYLFSGPVDGETAAEIIRDGYPLDLSAPLS